jgi:shikimate kinase
MLMERNIALIGFMTAGKTHVGAALSAGTGLPFVDIDLLVEEVERMPVHRIFQVKGEPYFRRLESGILRTLCEGSGQIIGCGGGTVLAEENRRLLRERCRTVWLRVSAGAVLDRLEQPDSPRRPVLEGLDAGTVVPELLRQREPLYAGADLAVDTDRREPVEIARQIALWVGLPFVGA